MAIFIAIYRYIDISRVFRHIVVYLLYIEGKSGHFNNVVVLMKAWNTILSLMLCCNCFKKLLAQISIKSKHLWMNSHITFSFWYGKGLIRSCSALISTSVLVRPYTKQDIHGFFRYFSANWCSIFCGANFATKYRCIDDSKFWKFHDGVTLMTEIIENFTMILYTWQKNNQKK